MINLDRTSIVAFGGALAALLLIPALVSAHPLGNFTINHYDAIRVSPSGVLVDHVLDMAEIPTFSERAAMDTDGDGGVSDAEAAGYAAARCDALGADLSLEVGKVPVPLTLVQRGISFPQGQGAPTLRLVCVLQGSLPAGLGAAGTAFSFSDQGQLERRGWREIVVQGDGATISGSTAEAQDVSHRLTVYPQDLLATPEDQASATWTALPGGPALPAFRVPDASPIGTAAAAETSGGTAPGPAAVGEAASAAVPNGISDFGTDVTALFQARDLTPLMLATSLLVAFGLGALHAVSPGHGKTVMAAYLVGTRGSTRHAIGLGMAVTVSHTIGVLVLGLISLSFAAIVPPERLYPILGVASGTIVIAIGSWLIVQRLRVLRRERALASAHAREHALGLEHSHEHAHEGADEHSDGHDHDANAGGWHSHGGARHTHLPQSTKPLSWRGLVALGLAGGMVPSVSALILLLGSFSLGRPAFGVVLTVAFGLGMAVVLVGVGMALVHARSFAERIGGVRLGRAAPWLPATTALVVVLAGAVMTVQALTLVD